MSKRYFECDLSTKPGSSRRAGRKVARRDRRRKAAGGQKRGADQAEKVVHRRGKWLRWNAAATTGADYFKPAVASVQEAELPEGYKKTDFKTRPALTKYSNDLDKVSFSRIQASRTKVLLPEKSGFLAAEEEEERDTYNVSQRDIVDAVDIASASKHFELHLPKFGPYRIDYTRNGRHLLIGGRMGHVAAFDWFTKELRCELNVMDVVNDVQWLHNETMYAVAQKKWTYIYDARGTELHCLKMLHMVQRMEFLPYHFLLATASSKSFLSWLDVSVGKLVACFPAAIGPIDVMCQNPSNAIIVCGTGKGTVRMWSPNEKHPLVTMFCHPCPVRAVTIDRTGRYMATAGIDRRIKIWDLRKYEEMWSLKAPPVSHMVFSDQRLLACAMGEQIRVYKDICDRPVNKAYMMHRCKEVVSDIRFCPYEDVLGVGHRTGFASLLIPGAGEANIDAFEANPFQTKNQRREMEVRSLLDKIQPEMITLDPKEIIRPNPDADKDSLEKKIKFLYSKQSNADLLEGTKVSGKRKRKAPKPEVKQAVRAQKQREILRQKRQIRSELVEMGVLKDDKRSAKAK